MTTNIFNVRLLERTRQLHPLHLIATDVLGNFVGVDLGFNSFLLD